MNEIVLLIMSMLVVSAYNIFAILYLNKVLGHHKVGFFTVLVLFFSSLIIPLQVYAAVPVSIVYLLGYILLLLILATTLRCTFNQLIFATSNVVFHVIVCHGIVLAFYSLITNQNMFGLLTNANSSLLINTFTYVLAFVFLAIFDLFSPKRKIRALVNHQQYIVVLSTLELSLIGLLTVSSFAYYYNLDLIWFSFYHLIVFTFSLGSFYVVYMYFYNLATIEQDNFKREESELALIRQVIECYGINTANDAIMMYIDTLSKVQINVLTSNIKAVLARKNIHFLCDLHNMDAEINTKTYKHIMNIIQVNSLVIEKKNNPAIHFKDTDGSIEFEIVYNSKKTTKDNIDYQNLLSQLQQKVDTDDIVFTYHNEIKDDRIISSQQIQLV